MKIVAKVVLWIGLALVVVGLGIAVWGGWIAYWHYATLSTGRSAEFDNPLIQLSIAGLGLVLGGFLWGLGLGMARKIKAEEVKPAPAPAVAEPARFADPGPVAAPEPERTPPPAV